ALPAIGLDRLMDLGAAESRMLVARVAEADHPDSFQLFFDSLRPGSLLFVRIGFLEDALDVAAVDHQGLQDAGLVSLRALADVHAKIRNDILAVGATRAIDRFRSEVAMDDEARVVGAEVTGPHVAVDPWRGNVDLAAAVHRGERDGGLPVFDEVSFPRDADAVVERGVDLHLLDAVAWAVARDALERAIADPTQIDETMDVRALVARGKELLLGVHVEAPAQEPALRAVHDATVGPVGAFLLRGTARVGITSETDASS